MFKFLLILYPIFISSKYSNTSFANFKFLAITILLKTETLYSIKSQQNSSPHSRMVQSMEKVGIRAVKAFLPTESLTQDGVGFKDAGGPIIK